MERKASTEYEQPHGEISIEPPTRGDAEAIRRIQAETWYDTYVSRERGVTVAGLRRRQEGEHGEKIETRRAFWRKQIETAGPDHAVFVARVDGAVVGFVAPTTLEGQRRIGALYLSPDSQGQGAGSRLLQQALEWHGPENDVYCHVAEGNDRAVRFYEHHGFELTGEYFDEDQPTDARIPELEMVHRGEAH